MSANAPVKRLWFPLGVILLFSAFVAWTYVTENTMRVAFLFMAVVLGGLIVGLWWGFGSGAFRWKSLVGGILGLVALGFLGRATLRFDGSADGATPLKFVWKWTPTAEEGLGVPEVAPSSPDSFGLVAALEGAAPFLGFLGEQRDGLVPDIGLDPDWEASPPEEMWRIRVGVGWSSFAVAQNRAVTQEQRGEKELVTCYDLASGRFLWAHEDETRFYEAMGGPGPRATPTISPEDGTVFAVGASGILNALDLGTGQLKWTATVLADETKNIEWGVSSSPLLAGDLVITAAGTAKEGETSPVVFAYDQETGEERWRYGSGTASYSSPQLITLNGQAQVVQVLAGAVVGLDPETGSEIWRFPWPGNSPKAAQPVGVSDNELLLTTSYGVTSHLLKIEGSQVEPIWSIRQMKTKFSSAIRIGDYAYGLDEGKLICMEIASGKRIWKGDRFGYGQNLLVGEWLLIQAEQGDVVLTRPVPEEHEEVARISPLSTKTWNAPTVAGRYLLVRNDREAVCLKLPVK